MEDQHSIGVLSALIEAKESDSSHHCQRVGTIAANLAAAVGLDSGQVESIRATAMIHDLGKISIPDEILNKPSRLTAEEFAIVKRHPQVGYKLIGAFPELDFARDGVLHHHERWDGHGYPSRRGGADIPIASRVIAIADSFDAMTSRRPYSAARAPREAVHEILRCAGTQFDPNLATAFADSFSAQEALGAEVDGRFVQERSEPDLECANSCGSLRSVVATDRQVGDRERNSARRWHMLEQSAPLVTMVARTLSSSERLVLELHYIERFSPREIAEIMETTEAHIDRTLTAVRDRVTSVRRAFVETLCRA